ncbi:MAG: hypothetical protein ABIH86_03000 [Planctomycetota bacterium]
MAIRDNYEMIKADAEDWSVGKFWHPRALVLLFFIWIFIHHFLSWVGVVDHPYMNFFIGRANFLVHELGHFVFMPFGQFLSIAGGSIFQCLAPVILMAGFYKQRDYFAIAFGVCWLATNFFYVATYIGDARAQELQLLSPSGASEPIHDWYFLLERLGWLNADTTLALLVRMLGVATMAIGLSFGSWIIMNMIYRKQKHPKQPVSESPLNSAMDKKPARNDLFR